LKTLVVNSGCQSFGLAAVLQLLLPDCTVTANPLPSTFDTPQQARASALALEGVDVWVSSDHFDLPEQHHGASGLSRLPRVLRVPQINFAAFQPDICYAVARDSGQLTHHHYNSAIAAWAYNHDVTPQDAQGLYTTTVFRDLGYLSLWEPSVAALRHSFAQSDLAPDFDTFFLHVQRGGNFMHSINHPKLAVLARLAKIVALHLGCDATVLTAPAEADDFLAQSSWPMYPEIARSLSLPGGGYQWKINAGTRVEGLRAFIDFSYAAYQAQGIAARDLVMLNRDDALYDRVLGAALERTAP
jgi:hypothetical protein